MYCESHDDEIPTRAGAPEVADLIALYQQCSNGGRPAFHADKFAAYFEDLAILRRAGDDFVYRHFGANVAEIAGTDMTGRLVSECDGEVAAFFQASYRRALKSGRPLHTLHCTIDEEDSHLWERLLLPMVDGAGNDVIVVFNRSQEAHFAADLADTPGLAHLSRRTEKYIDVPQVGLVRC